VKGMVFVFISWAALFAPVLAEEPVDFPDAALKAVVEAELWVSDPTPSDMQGLMVLSADSRQITDLTGLEHATNLQTLQLTHNQIGDISLLSSLANLQKLVLNNNQISDISVVSSLANLQHLDIHANNLSDISPVSSLANLQILILRINQISDISALSSMAYLHHLDLGNNQIGDISSLASLSSLKSLCLYNNQISDVSAISNLTALQRLELRNNQIGNISPLSGLTQLERLDLGGNQISDISWLLGLPVLEELHLFSNQISDISTLADRTGLGTLDLRWNLLNQEACSLYIPQIIANNPGLAFQHDSCFCPRLVISSSAGGSVVSPGEGVFTYTADERVLVEATALPGFRFNGFSGSWMTSQNPMFVTVNDEYQIQANFVSLLDVLYVDDDALSDAGPGNVTMSDPHEAGTVEHPFDSIQEAIDVAAEGASIIVRPGIYGENISLMGKCINIMGIDPNDPNAAGYPVVDGGNNGPVVGFTGGEGPSCTLAGFILTGGRGQSAGAIVCTNSSPTIANCLIVGNRTNETEGAVVRCHNSRAVLLNCTIADNDPGEQGADLRLIDSNVSLLNSILWRNGPNQIILSGTSEPTVKYTNLVGGWPGQGNTDADPLFARRGYWADSNDPNVVIEASSSDAAWIAGDYHLKSQAGRWDPETQTWVLDEITSPCIDVGNPLDSVENEPTPNGSIINMGAYGGTAEASRQY